MLCVKLKNSLVDARVSADNFNREIIVLAPPSQTALTVPAAGPHPPLWHIRFVLSRTAFVGTRGAPVTSSGGGSKP